MKILITGICGFLGQWIAKGLLEQFDGLDVIGFDNLSRPGSQFNRSSIDQTGIQFHHGDLRVASDLDALPRTDWVIDCAADASVLAGTKVRDGTSPMATPKQLLENNLIGTLHLLEYCRRHHSGLILISTSRVYSTAKIASVPLAASHSAFKLDFTKHLPAGVSDGGIDETFSTDPPLSIYGATKRSSEIMAQEYALAFEFPLRINRCGVLAGAGQLGRADQGIFAFWIHSHCRRRPLQYIGFGGRGLQVRDCLHPRDVTALVRKQILAGDDQNRPVIANVSGGSESARSLFEVTKWCDSKFGNHEIGSSHESRPYDVPWLVLDSNRARDAWNWSPSLATEEILGEIADHAIEHPDWLQRT